MSKKRTKAPGGGDSSGVRVAEGLSFEAAGELPEAEAEANPTAPNLADGRGHAVQLLRGVAVLQEVLELQEQPVCGLAVRGCTAGSEWKGSSASSQILQEEILAHNTPRMY